MWRNISSFVTSFVNETLDNESTANSSATPSTASSSDDTNQKTDGPHRHQHNANEHSNENHEVTEALHTAAVQPPSSSSVAAEQSAASLYEVSSESHTAGPNHSESEWQDIKKSEGADAPRPTSPGKDAPEESLSASLFSFLSSASQTLQLDDDKSAAANAPNGSAQVSHESAEPADPSRSVALEDAIPPLSQGDRAILHSSSADADSTFISRRHALEFTQRIASSASSFLSNLKNQTMSVLASKNEQHEESGQAIQMLRRGANEEEIAQLIEALHFQDKQNKLVIKEYNKIIHENESIARQQIGERDAEIRFLRNELVETQKKLSALEVSAKALQGSADGNERHAKDADALLADKTEQIKALIQVNRDLYSKYSAISSEKPFDPASSSLDERQLQEEIQKALQQNQSDSGDTANSVAKNALIVRLSQALEELTKRVGQREEEVSQLLASNFSSHQAKYETQLQAANEKYLSLQAEFENQSKSWLTKENELRLIEKKLQATLQTMRNEMEKNEKLLENREQLLSQKDEQVFSLEKQLMEKDQQRKAAEDTAKAAHTELSALKESLHTLQSQLQQHKDSTAQVHTQLANSLEEVAQLKTENQQLKQQNGANSIDAAKESELQGLIELQKKLIANHSEQLTALQKQNEQLRLEGEQQQHTREIHTAQLHSDLKSAQSALSDTAAKEKKLAEENGRLTAEMALLKKTLQQKENESKEWKDKYETQLAAAAKTPRPSANASSTPSAASSSAPSAADPWSNADGKSAAAAESSSQHKDTDELDELDELIASFESK